MTYAAFIEVLHLHVVFRNEFPAQLLLVGRFPPLHVEYFFARAYLLGGIVVTLEAPFHVKSVLLPGERHLVHLAVACRATDAFVHVDAVVEIDEIGKIVDAIPPDRNARGKTLPDRLQQRGLCPELRMAGHARFRGRHARVVGILNGRVTVTAIDAETIDVVLVTERDRLFARHTDPRGVWRPIDRIRNPSRADNNERRTNDTDPGDGIGTRRKYLAHFRHIGL